MIHQVDIGTNFSRFPTLNFLYLNFRSLLIADLKARFGYSVSLHNLPRVAKRGTIKVYRPDKEKVSPSQSSRILDLFEKLFYRYIWPMDKRRKVYIVEGVVGVTEAQFVEAKSKGLPCSTKSIVVEKGGRKLVFGACMRYAMHLVKYPYFSKEKGTSVDSECSSYTSLNKVRFGYSESKNIQQGKQFHRSSWNVFDIAQECTFVLVDLVKRGIEDKDIEPIMIKTVRNQVLKHIQNPNEGHMPIEAIEDYVYGLQGMYTDTERIESDFQTSLVSLNMVKSLRVGVARKQPSDVGGRKRAPKRNTSVSFWERKA